MCGLNPELDIAGPTYGIGVLQGNHLLTRDGRISVTGGEKKIVEKTIQSTIRPFYPSPNAVAHKSQNVGCKATLDKGQI